MEPQGVYLNSKENCSITIAYDVAGMGCGTSTTAVLEPGAPNGKVAEGGAPGVRPPPTGADDDDIPTELLPEPVKPPLAFEISIDDNEDDQGTQGLVKKHPPRPPRRLQRLNSIEPTAPSLSELQEKMESAEKRRLTILQNRIASANKASRKMMGLDRKELQEDQTLQTDDIMDSPTKQMTELKNQINAEEHGVQS